MQLTLHLTNKCNLNCKYCFVEHGDESMSQDIAFAAVKLAMENVKVSGLLFYGGEPLLERELIYNIVDYSKTLMKKTGHQFYYKITTNGTLLDEEFLKFSKQINMTIGFSHDGLAQDDCRLFVDGKASFAMLEDKIPLLLKHQAYAIGMSVTDPSTVHKASGIVNFLFEKGFRYLHISHNYCRTAPWTRKHLLVLEEEYRKMAQLYLKWTKAEEKIYLSPFDAKILSHLKGEQYNIDRIKMAQNQPSVNTDGKIYYSSKYLGEKAFEIGDVFSGINIKRQQRIAKRATIPPKTCLECCLRTRCNYAYDSLVAQGTEIVADVNPVQCAHEQLLTPIVDQVATELFEEDNALFIHKHYNRNYPIISMMEDLQGKS